jgi:ligand-binding SRPBCC domain-containing protein
LVIPKPRPEVFDFFSRASNLERITPPFLRFRIKTPEPIEMRRGALIDYNLRIHGVPALWRTLIAEWEPPYQFVDMQLKGPYKLWHHTHTFSEENGGTRMVDEVRYEVPLGPLGDIVHRFFVRKDVENIFRFRNSQIASLLEVAS